MTPFSTSTYDKRFAILLNVNEPLLWIQDLGPEIEPYSPVEQLSILI